MSYCPECAKSERDLAAARAEAARLRQHHAEAVALLKIIQWHQDGDSSIYVCACCRGMHPSCEQNGNWIAGTKFGHKADCALARLLASSAKTRLT